MVQENGIATSESETPTSSSPPKVEGQGEGQGQNKRKGLSRGQKRRKARRLQKNQEEEKETVNGLKIGLEQLVLGEVEDQGQLGDKNQGQDHGQKPDVNGVVVEEKVANEVRVISDYWTDRSGIQDDYTAVDFSLDQKARSEAQECYLKDEKVIHTFMEVIDTNKHLFQGKIVLDLGCGTGILSMFAAKAGAARVIGIDRSGIAIYARQIVKDNKLDHIISIIHGKVEEIELPDGIDKVDIIICDWAGRCLLFKSLLISLIYARDKWLKHGGLIFPDKGDLSIAAAERGFYKKKLEWWKNVYEFDMSGVTSEILCEPRHVLINENAIITDSYILLEIDTYKLKLTDLENIHREFELTATQNDRIDALVLYVTLEFNECHVPLLIRSWPGSEKTRFKQTVFMLKGSVFAVEGEKMSGKVTIKQDIQERNKDLLFEITVNFDGELQKLHEVDKYKLEA